MYEFVSSRLHCIISRTDKWVSRPLASALLDQRSKVVVHMDLLILRESNHINIKYLLVMKKDFTGYEWLHKCEAVHKRKAKKTFSECTMDVLSTD